MPDKEDFSIITCRATAILRNEKNVQNSAEVALRLLTSVKFDEKKDGFWVVLPYLVNLGCCYQKLGFTARAYETLERGAKLIDENYLKTVEKYQMGRLIVCACHIWRNMQILLEESGLKAEDQIDNWQVKNLLIEKQKHLFQ